MIKKIIKKLDLESNINLISPIDDIKLSLQGENLCNIIQNYKSTDPIEKYIQKLLCSEESNIMDLFSSLNSVSLYSFSNFICNFESSHKELQGVNFSYSTK